jgi:hypothetical protein
VSGFNIPVKVTLNGKELAIKSEWLNLTTLQKKLRELYWIFHVLNKRL